MAAPGLRLKEIREAIKTQLANKFDRGLNVYAYHPGSVQYPCLIVRPASDYVEYFATFGGNGLSDVNFELELMVVGRLVDAQIVIDDFLSVGTGSAASIVDALMADPTLGGKVQTVRPLSALGYGDVESGDGPLSVRIPLAVTIKKNGANA